MFSLKLSPEQIEIRRTVRQFAEKEIKPIALARDREEDFDKRFPWHVLAKAEKLGLRTLALSENKGGGGADALTDCIVAEELATADVGVAATLNHTSDLARLFFDHYMTDEQRDRLLPAFLSDERFHLAIAGHEPDTDLGWAYHRPNIDRTGYRTTAVRHGDDWIINGTKNFITNAPIAKLILVQVQTGLKRGGMSGVSMIFVERNTPGLTVYEHDKVGRRLGSNGEIVFENCRVPAANMVSGSKDPLTQRMTQGRARPRFQALNLGIGRAAYEAALDYARMRVQGGRPIIEHQTVAMRLADMAIALEQARSLIWQAAWAADHLDAYQDGSLPDLPLQLITKVATSETVFRVATDAAQIFGGMGVMRELPMQKYVRDALIFLHSEHTNDVARLKIAEHLAGWQRLRPDRQGE
ncbi:MAG: acyl-CoA dehydrogenase family protein [Xanthobacteraceae bacterium]